MDFNTAFYQYFCMLRLYDDFEMQHSKVRRNILKRNEKTLMGFLLISFVLGFIVVLQTKLVLTKASYIHFYVIGSRRGLK